MFPIIKTVKCAKGCALPISKKNTSAFHTLMAGNLPVGTGWELTQNGYDAPLFVISGYVWLAQDNSGFSEFLPLLTALQPVDEIGEKQFTSRKNGYSIAVITLSDKGAQGMRHDGSGPVCAEMLNEALPVCFSRNFLLPDDDNALRGLLAELSLTQKYDLICTSGGTGLGPRDITPQATAKLLDLELPGFVQAMMAKSLEATPRAIISRALAGVIGKCLVINLPGSPKAVKENLAAVLPALEHALAKLNGDSADCGA